jgi:hypothetical protein
MTVNEQTVVWGSAMEMRAINKQAVEVFQVGSSSNINGMQPCTSQGEGGGLGKFLWCCLELSKGDVSRALGENRGTSTS